ncbi:MAG: HAMP domain-containing histidine kinase [Candidatus Eiseniibacteriota bacterium]|nr:MAG: HAMP domain-containing histidine kinase [Candidatus Eisenbacteria bacterium]
MRNLSVQRPGGTQLLRGYLFLGSSLLVALVFIYTNRVVHKLEEQAGALSAVFARFCAVAAIPASEDEELRDIYSEVIKNIRFPVVVTDVDGRPYAWAGIGIDIDAVSEEQAALMDPANPSPGPLSEIARIVKELDKANPPIPMIAPGGTHELGKVHYGESGIVKEMRWVPLVELAAVFLFMGFGYLGFKSLKVSEQRFIWVGMAKETAHQLGTPISSLLGWLEVIRDRSESAADEKGPVEIERPLFEQLVHEMESDVERLQKVANRFGNIGSIPNLQLQDVVPLVRGTVHYFRRRLPKVAHELQVVEEYEAVPLLNLNRELMEWALENILKNSLDALDKSGGRIEVSVKRNPEQETVELTFSDDGRGMSPSDQSKAFQPGFSTKERGWGLGLTLARRIVQEYHGGKIWIKSSEPGKGTVVVISFPV